MSALCVCVYVLSDRTDYHRRWQDLEWDGMEHPARREMSADTQKLRAASSSFESKSMRVQLMPLMPSAAQQQPSHCVSMPLPSA